MSGNSSPEPVRVRGGSYRDSSYSSPPTLRWPRMIYWVHIARAIDRVTLHRDRCSEVPSTMTSSDFWEGGWFDYPDKERALRAMEQAGANEQRRCPLCKP